MSARHGTIVLCPWFGGKATHLDFILPLLPPTESFVDCFGGGGSVTLNKPRTPVQVWSDLFEPMAILMRVTRDDPRALARRIRLTPYSRSAYRMALDERESMAATDIERAAGFLAAAMQKVGANQQPVYRSSWSRAIDGTVGQAKRTSAMMGRPDRIMDASRRLQGVEIENRDALDVIRDRDSPDTLFYLDPPYVKSTRGHGDEYGEFEFNDGDHRALAAALNSIQGLAAVSGYESELYEELYPASKGWVKALDKSKAVRMRSESIPECLWMSYGSGP